MVFVASIGVGGWEEIVYKSDGSLSDSPLPLAMAKAVSKDSLMYQLIIGVGLFGLVASFHGLILAGGRATMELGKINFAPTFKFNSQTSTYNIKRQPSWTDRILYRCKDNVLQLVNYESNNNVQMSDHRPVFA
jgi:hypothetical protein